MSRLWQGIADILTPRQWRDTGRTSTAYTTQQARHQMYPDTDAGWTQRYAFLRRWYEGSPYDELDYTGLGLWRSTDDFDKVQQFTRRLCEDAAFVVETNVTTLAGGRWSLQNAPSSDANALQAGEAVWRRSQLQEQREDWIRTLAICGDVHLHAYLDESMQGQIAAYAPEHVQVFYALDNRTIERVIIRIPYYDDATETWRIWRRTVTRDTVEEAEQAESGDWMVLRSGTHTLGVVPHVHLRYMSITGAPEHGISAMARLQSSMSAVDSMISHLRAISDRFAHPHTVVKNARFNTGTDVERFGRVIVLPDGDADVSYLEAGMGAIAPIWQVISEYQDSVRGTIPEFTLAGSGANTSGRALEFRADQFRRKMRALSARIWAGVARATWYAVALERGVTTRPDEEPLRIVGPPPLPIDEPGRLQSVLGARAAGLMSRADAVRALQALGMIDEEADADAYAATLDDDDTGGQNGGRDDKDGDASADQDGDGQARSDDG